MGGPGLGRCIAYYICYSPLEERKSILFPPSFVPLLLVRPQYIDCPSLRERTNNSPFEAATIFTTKGSAAARDNNIARLLFVRRRFFINTHAHTEDDKWRPECFKPSNQSRGGFARKLGKRVGEGERISTWESLLLPPCGPIIFPFPVCPLL